MIGRPDQTSTPTMVIVPVATLDAQYAPTEWMMVHTPEDPHVFASDCDPAHGVGYVNNARLGLGSSCIARDEWDGNKSWPVSVDQTVFFTLKSEVKDHHGYDA